MEDLTEPGQRVDLQRRHGRRPFGSAIKGILERLIGPGGALTRPRISGRSRRSGWCLLFCWCRSGRF